MVSGSKYFFSLISDQPMRHQTLLAFHRSNINQITGVIHIQWRRRINWLWHYLKWTLRHVGFFFQASSFLNFNINGLNTRFLPVKWGYIFWFGLFAVHPQQLRQDLAYCRCQWMSVKYIPKFPVDLAFELWYTSIFSEGPMTYRANFREFNSLANPSYIWKCRRNLMRSLMINFHSIEKTFLPRPILSRVSIVLGHTVGLPEGMINSHSEGPQRSLVVLLWTGLCELVRLHYSHLCPISKEYVIFKQAYSKGMRNEWASLDYCLPVTKDVYHNVFVFLHFD